MTMPFQVEHPWDLARDSVWNMSTFLTNAHDFRLFLRFIPSASGFSSDLCSWFPAFSPVRPLRLRLFFWPMLMISGFFSGSSASPPAFLLIRAHDFRLFLRFVRCIQKQEKIPNSGRTFCSIGIIVFTPLKTAQNVRETFTCDDRSEIKTSNSSGNEFS